MRRVSLCVVAVLALVVAFVVPEGAVTAKKGRKPVTCNVAPFTYTVTDSRIEPVNGGSLLFYSANGTTTLSCPEGHPWNASRFTVEFIDARLPLFASDQTAVSDLRQKLGFAVEIAGHGFTRALAYDVSCGPCYGDSGGSGASFGLSIVGVAKNHTLRLRLNGVGSFDATTEKLVSLTVSEGEIRRRA